jgi:hypothetical protein
MGALIAARTANRHSIARLHLASRAAPSDIPQVAAGLIGIHAARLQSPIVSMATRVDGADANRLARHLYQSPDLIKLRCMRGTLHIAPLELAPTLHAATRAARLAVCGSLAKPFAVEPKAEQALIEAILDRLAGRALTSDQIAAETGMLASRKTGLTNPTPYLRTLIKTLWERGDLCIRNLAPDWKREGRAYALLGDVYPSLDLHALDRAEATAALFAAYFRRYGPASIADAAWWSGAGEARVRQFIADHARDLVEVRIEGIPAACYLFVEDRDALVDCRAEPHVEFLAYEDNLLKGYKESRARFVAAVDYAKVFNLIGEARATILADGRIAGVWQFNKRTGRIDCILFGDLDKGTSALIDSRRRRLEELLTNGAFPPMF